MHFFTGRAENALFDIPARYRGTARLQPRIRLAHVERFMKHYFLTAKHVADLTAILCSRLEECRPNRRRS